MNKRLFIILVVIIFLIIELYSGFQTFIDFGLVRKTILVFDQNKTFIKDLKEEYNIDYNISAIEFMPGFPDGYYLTFYKGFSKMEQESKEDEEDPDSLFHYFRYEAIGFYKNLIFLIIEIIIEIFIIYYILRN